MKWNRNQNQRCTYVVPIARDEGSAEDLRPFSEYLSSLNVAGCDVVVLDASPREQAAENRNALRWVSRHVVVDAGFDLLRTAASIATCDKIIVAAEDVRYNVADLSELCVLLDVHEFVEPREYLDPLPWWGGIDAGRMLLQRGIGAMPERSATFGFRRTAMRVPRGIQCTEVTDAARTLALCGTDVRPAHDLFVRRCPPALREWVRRRPLQRDHDADAASRTAFFFALLPAALLLALLGGTHALAGCAGAMGLASVVVALRGRAGAGAFFPLRACFFAPLWIVERSLSIHWALVRKMRAGSAVPAPALSRDRRERAASGE